MNAQKFLAGILVLQLGLVAYQWWPSGTAVAAPKRLVPFELDDVRSLTVQSAPRGDEEVKPVELRKEGDEWVVASSENYPAKRDKVEEVLSKLIGIEVSTPIATKPHRHNQLNVGDVAYGRRVRLSDGSTEISLVIGSSGASGVNVRREDQNEVYNTRGFSEWSIGDRVRSYVEDKLVDAQLDSLQTVVIHSKEGTFRFAQEEGEWVLEEPEVPVGRQLRPGAIKSMVRRVTGIRLSEPVGREVRDEYGLDGSVRVEWTETRNGETVEGGYTVGAIGDRDGYVKVDGSDFVVSVGKWSLEPIRDAKLEDLLKPEEKDD